MSIRDAILCICVVSLVGSVACAKRTPGPVASSSPSESPLKLEIETVTLQPVSDESVPGAEELVQAYNKRNLGSPGWRRVSMELITDNRVTSTFVVVNLWRDFQNEERTLFLLQEPDGLKGTSYLLRENTQSSPEMQVHLFLPAGERKVFEVAHDNFDEGLLGSDFTYNDMRMSLPVKNWRYRITGKTTLVNEPAWVVEAQPVNNSNERTAWSKIRLYLARNFQLLLGADFFANDEGKPEEANSSKHMRVQSFKQDNGVWTATRMLMAGSHQRFTVLTLKDARFSTATIDPQIFSPDRLPLIADKIRMGWNPD
jgi:outer membrane lipoprotein-sorting protein